MNTALKLADEHDLFAEYRETENNSFRDEIIERYVYIAEIIARKFTKNNRSYNNGMEYDDIYQVACLGLIYAADRYDPDMGVKFASFATPTIIGELKRFFRDKGFVIKVPSRLYEVFRKAERIKRTEGGDAVRDMSRIIGVSEDVVKAAYKAGDAAFVKSLENEILGDDDNIALVDTIGMEDSSFLVIENSDFIDYCKKQLDEDERRFVDLRYYEEYNQKEISKIMHMSQMQISRLEKRLLKKLRRMYFGD